MALGLVQDGRVVLGVLGCPCLPHPSVSRDVPCLCLVLVMSNVSTACRCFSAAAHTQGPGCVFVAQLGQGCVMLTVDGDDESAATKV